jgi:hypothetical protein
MDWITCIGISDKTTLFRVRDFLHENQVGFSTKPSKFEQYRWVLILPAEAYQDAQANGDLVHSFFSELFYWIKYTGDPVECEICHDLTDKPKQCDVCGTTLCPTCVEGHTCQPEGE